MKKLFSILLVLLSLSFSLYSCGDKDNKGDNGNENVTPEPVKYTVTWKDENGNTLSSVSVAENSVPSYVYTVNDTAEWDYTFIGWAQSADGEVLASIPQASKDATYYARVSAVKQKYTVKFNSLGGSVIDDQIVEYGAKASSPENPQYDGHRFVGWVKSEGGSELVNFDEAITGNVEYFASWNEMVDIKGLLSALLNGYELNPLSYIPESMLSDYSDNLVDADSIVSDYSTFVNVSDITYGHGEQWHMVVDNLEQTKIFFNTLSVIEAISATSISAFNNYFDSNPADTANYAFASGIYNVTINFDGEIIYYILDYTADIPMLGNVAVQIALAMDAESGVKTVRIQLGDANALSYTVKENSYEFAIKYLGVRRAMFTVSRDDDGNVSGKIYEYLTVSSVEMASAAEFFITDTYVSVVGNKASGMVGFDGYICELYDTDNGKMIGYEVMETALSIVYNTLWFNLDSVDGITDIKYIAATKKKAAQVFVNGASKQWEARKVGGIGEKMLSRRFDIEFRTQYVYSYDPTTQTYTEHKIEVPMFFIQEENYDTVIDDVRVTNGISIAITVDDEDYLQLLSDYDELIPAFIASKDSITVEVIINYIGDKITFTEV